MRFGNTLAPLVRHTPRIEKQPPVALAPLAKVEVAVVLVALIVPTLGEVVEVTRKVLLPIMIEPGEIVVTPRPP